MSWDSLPLAGQIECALLDNGHRSADQAVWLTDGLAGFLLQPDLLVHEDLVSSCRDLGETLPEVLRIPHPEGFSYYGLHPRDFIDVFADQPGSGSSAVFGLRSMARP